MAPAALSPILANSIPSIFSPSSTDVITKSLLRKQIVGARRTRDEAGLDSPDSNRPMKIARTVTFDDKVKEEIYTTLPNPSFLVRELESIKLSVYKAIRDHVDGISSDSYDEIKALFSKQGRRFRDSDDTHGRSEGENIRLHLLALTNNVSMLDRRCGGLVRAVLDYEWVGREDSFVRDYTHFLGHLASAHGAYVPDILSALVLRFSAVSMSSGRLPNCPIVLRDQLSARVHMVLKRLLRLIPSASGILSPILTANFPASDESKRRHMLYVRNLVAVKEYAPELRSDILRLITDRVINLDMEMRTDFDELDEQDAAAILEAVTYDNIALGNNDLVDDDDDDESDDDDDSVTSDEGDELNIKEIQAKVEKLDAMMDFLFELYEPEFMDPDSLQAQNTFDLLLSHFRTIILPMYKSRHTQFLLFHFAQKSDHFVDIFTGECAYLAFNSERSDVEKQSAAAYLASFVARGRHVSSARVLDVFQFFGASLNQMLEEQESSCRGPDLHRYNTFYATTQALIYIFCFRWRDLIVRVDGDSDDDDDDEDNDEEEEDYHNRNIEWHPSVKALLERTINSKFNPLKVCSPVIVAEFASIACHLRFMYVYSKIESNKSVSLAAAQRRTTISAFRDSGANHGAANMELDAFFPFDPYRLPISRSKWVVRDYAEWQELVPKGMMQRDDDDEEEEEEESSDEEGDEDEEEFDGEEEDTATDVAED